MAVTSYIGPPTDPLNIHKPGSRLSRYTDPLGVNAPPATANTAPLTDLQVAGQAGLSDLERERQGLTVSRDQQMAIRLQQQRQLTGLQSAAAGSAPSAAQIAGAQQADAMAQRQMAMAQAVRSNPAQALRMASQGSVAGAGAVADDAAAQRASEILQARGTLVGALGGMRGADIGLQQADQQSRDRNMAALLAQRQLQQQIAAGKVSADQIAAGQQNARDAAIVGAAGSGIGAYGESTARARAARKAAEEGS